MNDREKLLKRLQICDFVLAECNEFLDTHTNNREALAYFKKYQKLREEALREFQDRFGPVTAVNYDGYKDRFTYVDNPWPWEVNQ